MIYCRPFLCSECGLRFVRNDYLVIHMRRHKGEKPYKCKYCNKGFPRATDLTVHERYHVSFFIIFYTPCETNKKNFQTGEKTHLCTICGKGFQRAYNLLVHTRVHTGMFFELFLKSRDYGPIFQVNDHINALIVSKVLLKAMILRLTYVDIQVNDINVIFVMKALFRYHYCL